jgi:hypothetical protein
MLYMRYVRHLQQWRTYAYRKGVQPHKADPSLRGNRIRWEMHDLAA